LADILAVREKLLADMAAASQGPHGGRGPLGIPVPVTPEEGVAWLQSPSDGRYLLPHLYPYVEALYLSRIDGAPPWEGEPKNELEALAMLDAIEKCCHGALKGLLPPPAPAVPPPVETLPPPPRVDWTKRGPFDLTLNTNAHTAERGNASADFAGEARPWEVFVRLVERFPAYYPPRDLGREVWNPDGNDGDPDDNTVQQAISTIRRLLRPLGINVLCSRKVGYVLAEWVEKSASTKGAKRRGKRAGER
jgi:hypothetical protein